MNKMEKFENAVNLGPVKDKSDIPVFPMIMCYAAVPAGKTQADIFRSNEEWVDALVKCYEAIGTEPDVVFPMNPRDTTFTEQMKVSIPGEDLGENELFQLQEEELMFRDDYKTIIDKGYGSWQFPFVASIQKRPMEGPFLKFKLIGRFMKAGKGVKQNRKFWNAKGIPLMFHNGTAPAFDTFSLSRRLENFFFDIYDEPELVRKAIERATPDIIKTALMGAKKGDRIAVFAMRSSATFISPDMFEEFAFPALKQMIEAFHAKSVTSVIHADANWLEMLPWFRKVPKGSCIIELDGDTDIVKAKEILAGYQCIRGDLPATILAFGTEKETQDYCDKLVDLAMDGGFIIGSGCEVPLNAKIENVRILMNCTK